MAIIKRPFRVKTVDGYDTHHFETSADMVIQDSTRRFVTDTEKSTWNGKAPGSHKHPESDITNAAQYLSSTGYRKLPGGLILQWGTITVNEPCDGKWSKNYNFPLAFPNLVIGAWGSYNISGNDVGNITTRTRPEVPGGFDFYKPLSGGNIIYWVTYFALGY